MENIPEAKYTVEVKDYKFAVNDKQVVTVYYIMPKNITADTKVFLAMHGTGMTDDSFAKTFRYLAEKENMIVIAPRFAADMFKETKEYGQINITSEQRNWTCYIVDRIFEDFVEQFDLDAQKYILFGFSMGGQFAARTAVFSDSKYIDYVIASGVRQSTDLDDSKNLPDGIKNASAYKNTFSHNLNSRKVYLAIGSKDNGRWQGSIEYFNKTKAYCEANNLAFPYKLFVLEGVGHAVRLPYIIDIVNGLADGK